MLEARNISKKFSGVAALSNINLQLFPGKVNAIIGENGAGKSTLMKIFSGVHTNYEGDILLNEKPIRFASTKAAEAAGIVIIHQELNLVPYLSISENIFLGKEIVGPFGVLNKKKMHTLTEKLLHRLNLDISPDKKIAQLKVGEQQLVEIAKALYTDASIIIMDEPTSAITDKEVDNLFSIISQLKKEGKTIAYISHKFKELFAIADHYVVLRDGCTIHSGEMQDATQELLIEKMTGRNISTTKRTSVVKDAAELLSVKSLSLKNGPFKSGNSLTNISFTLSKGQILGIYGLMGSGRSELLETIFGLHPKICSGEIFVDGVKRQLTSPTEAIKAGIALVPEDRKAQGLILNQSVKKNLSLTTLKQLQQLGLMLNRNKESRLAQEYINSLSIKTASDSVEVKNLSGGNQQKVVIAKWLATKPKILLLDEPTRGVDIRAKTEIYELMRTLASDGMGVIMVSSELPEILTVADRVLVMCEGEITADLDIATTNEQEILRFAIHKNRLTDDSPCLQTEHQ